MKPHLPSGIKLIGINVSLVKTRLRAAHRGEIPSSVGFRQPNPYENVCIFLECAIYQTHVITYYYPTLSLHLTLQSDASVGCLSRVEADVGRKILTQSA